MTRPVSDSGWAWLDSMAAQHPTPAGSAEVELGRLVGQVRFYLESKNEGKRAGEWTMADLWLWNRAKKASSATGPQATNAAPNEEVK